MVYLAPLVQIKNSSVFTLKLTDSDLKQGNVIVQAGFGDYITFLYNKVNIYKNFIILFILSATLFFIIYFLLNDLSPLYCIYEETERKISVANELAKNVNSSVTDNNTNINVEKPDLHIHNPNVNLPSSVGTAISSLGASGAVSAGIYAFAQGAKRGSMPITAKAGMVALGGGIGGVLFVGTNAVNTWTQKSLDCSKNNISNNDKNSGGTYPASSVIEEGDSVENVLNLFYCNLLLSVFILLLLVTLLYLYINKTKIKQLVMFVNWVLLVITSFISIYIAYSLVEDIDIISNIYQDDRTVSVLKNADSNVTDGIKLAMEFLYANLVLSISILLLLYYLIILYMNTKILNEKWDLSFIKKIIGEGFYYYFMKGFTFTSKSNKLWMLFGFILLIIASVSSISFAYFLIVHIDIITEMYQNTKYK